MKTLVKATRTNGKEVRMLVGGRGKDLTFWVMGLRREGSNWRCCVVRAFKEQDIAEHEYRGLERLITEVD